MKNLIFIFVFLIFTCSGGEDVNAQNHDDIFTIYLVRHSEKDLESNNSSNPPLSECGQIRSENLRRFFKDVPLEVIYSTNYIRTTTTAMPTATAKELGIENYNAEHLKEFSELLLDRKQNALVVGHSNTTGVLAGFLINENLDAYDSGIYDRIYQVVIYNDKARLHLLHMPLDCID